MYPKVNVCQDIYWIGANDRRKQLFENLWPLPDGVSYNSYLIVDSEKTALVDTLENGSAGNYLDQIELLLQGKPLDYLVINHMEPDHSGEIGEIVRHWPEVKVVGNAKTFSILKEYYGIGADSPHALVVNDGDTLPLGRHTLKFVFTPWVHWPETMMSYDLADGILFSADAFGTFGTLDGGLFDDEIEPGRYDSEMRRYYSNIVGKYSNMVQKAFEKLKGAEIKTICPLHGPIWRTDPGYVIGLYDRWSRYQAEEGVVIIYASMYGNGARTADYIARRLSENGVRKIKVHDVSKTHISYLINDLWNYKGVILGSCAYNAQMFPLMEQLTREILHMGLKERKLGLFGSYSWNGGGVRNLLAFAEEIKWEQVAPAVDIQGIPTAEKLAACDALAAAMAANIREA